MLSGKKGVTVGNSACGRRRESDRQSWLFYFFFKWQVDENSIVFKEERRRQPRRPITTANQGHTRQWGANRRSSAISEIVLPGSKPNRLPSRNRPP